MTFEEAVQAASCPINGAYHPGKQALERRHRDHVTCGDPRRLTGSIYLDAILAREPDHAQEPRWDYGLGYKPARGSEQAVWIEVHSATTREVSAVLRKLQWLCDWMTNDARQLRRLTNRSSPDERFVWIASGGVNIPPNSPQFRRLRQSAIKGVQKHLMLP